MTKLQLIQKALGVATDDIWGNESQSALDDEIAASRARRAAQTTSPVPVDPGLVEFDERTEKNLKTLNAGSEALFRKFMRQLVPFMAQHGVVAKIIDGSRTWAQQDALYAQGRTKPGKIVTKARGGQSDHNFQCAADIGLFRNGKYLEDDPLYIAAGPIGESVGLEWGGRWKSIKDYPHYSASQFKQAKKV